MCYIPKAKRAGRNTLNGKRAGGQQYMITRLIFKICTGVDPGPLLITHTCDNPPCCNPNHFIVGTQTFNMRDAKMKGRTSAGEHHGRSKLTAMNIVQIRVLFAAGYSRTELAGLFNVSTANILRITRGETWTTI